MTELVTEPIVRNERLAALGIDAYPSSTTEVWTASGNEAWQFSPGPSLLRGLTPGVYDPEDWRYNDPYYTQVREDMRGAGMLISKDEANKRYAIPGELQFDTAEIPDYIAKQRYQLKRDELNRRNTFRRAQGGFVEKSGSLVTSLLVSAMDPLNIASAFIPVVGEARFAILAAKLGKTGARAAAGAIEGAAGAALLEPIIYNQAQLDDADYSAADSLLNIAFGTVLGGGLHMGAGAIGDFVAGRALKGLPAAIENAPARVREAALRGAVAAQIEGRPVNVAQMVPELDPIVQAAARAEPIAAERTELLQEIPDFTDAAPRTLANAPSPQGFVAGELQGKGAAARYSNYSEVGPQDRKWIEGLAEEVRTADYASLVRMMDEKNPGIGKVQLENEGGYWIEGTFPRWFKDANEMGERLSKDKIAAVAQKMLNHEPLGKAEIRIARDMFDEARTRRTQNAEQMTAYRRTRERERLDEVARLDEDDSPYFLSDDRKAAAEITERTAATEALDEAAAVEADLKLIEEENAELQSRAGELTKEEEAALTEADELIAEAEADGKIYEEAAACLARVL